MEWFAFSSKFYLDLDDQGVSEKAQMLLMRICAYVADNETSGLISDAAIRKLGIRQVSTRLQELLDHQLIVRVSVNSRATREQLANNSHTNSRTTRAQLPTNSMYEIPAWFKWNEPLERLVKKRKADREAIANKRKSDTNVVRQSHECREMSHDYINSNNNKEISTYVEKSSPVSNARDSEEARGPAVNVQAWKLVRAAIPDVHPQAVRTDLAMRVNQLITAGTPPATITAGLELWLAKPDAGTGLLPWLVSQAAKTANPPTATGRAMSTADKRVAEAQALKALFDNTPTPPPMREIQ